MVADVLERVLKLTYNSILVPKQVKVNKKLSK